MTTATKTCIRCGQDCANKPRTKDAQGRYTCRECYDKAVAAASARTEVKPLKAAAAQPAGAKPVAPLRASVPAGAPKAAVAAPAPPEPAFDAGEGFGEGFSLADDAGLGAIAAAQPKECTNCGLFLPQETVVCTRCGLNTQTGKVLGTDKQSGEGRQCIKCGYSLKGLKSIKCPECGTENRVKTKQEKLRDYDKKTSRDTARNAYIQPLILFAVGLTISLLVAGGQGGGTEEIVGYLVSYAVLVPIGVLAFFICCLLWLGFDAPIHLTAIRLLGVFAMTDAVGSVMSIVKIPILSWGVTLITYIGLLMKVLDLERTDAIVVAAMNLILKIAIGVTVIAYLVEAGYIEI